MPLIWCSISGHGLGHAAQVLPVLRELGRLVPGVSAVLRTTVPPWFFQGRLDVPWEVSPVEQDIGCVQHGPLKIDVEVTWAEHVRFHMGWKARVAEEAHAIRSKSPALVLSDISYLAIEAGVEAQIPTVGLCSLSWDQVLEPFTERGQSAQIDVIRQIKRSYSMAEMMIRPAPGVPMTAFRKIVDVGPIVLQRSTADQSWLRKTLGAGLNERVVLVSFGGITLDALPFLVLERLTRYRFVVNGKVPDACARTRSAASVPIPFGSLLASADIIVTKPGYSTIVEAVACSKPVVYVRRYNFADEPVLVEYAHRFGRAVELSAADFASGRWEDALDAVWSAPHPKKTAPLPTGAAQAAEILAGYLLTNTCGARGERR